MRSGSLDKFGDRSGLVGGAEFGYPCAMVFKYKAKESGVDLVKSSVCWPYGFASSSSKNLGIILERLLISCI